MMRHMKSFLRDQEGQGMTEYIIIVAIIAIAAIAVITLFGQNLRALFAASSNALGGSEDTSVSSAGSGNSNIAAARRNLSNFGTNKAQFW
jgi:Flp pilus assembly pilin Flp